MRYEDELIECARILGTCKYNLTIGKCRHDMCASCEQHKISKELYDIQDDENDRNFIKGHAGNYADALLKEHNKERYDTSRLYTNGISTRYQDYCAKKDQEQKQKQRRERRSGIGLWLGIIAILCLPGLIPTVMIASFLLSETKAPVVKQEQSDLIDRINHVAKLSRKVGDITDEGVINCTDRAIFFKWYWDKHYKEKCILMTNYNPAKDFNHMFVKVDGILVEPQAKQAHKFEEFWGNQYDKDYNGGNDWWLRDDYVLPVWAKLDRTYHD